VLSFFSGVASKIKQGPTKKKNENNFFEGKKVLKPTY